MSADELWPFTDVRTVGQRGDLLVLEGRAPDGKPVTITRLAPGAAADPVMQRRFHEAVAEARRCIGPADPWIGWWDTATLSPWAATYDDPHHGGADRIGAFFDPHTALPARPPPSGERPASVESLTRAGPSPVQRRVPLIVSAFAGVAVLVLALGISGAVLRDQDAADPSPSPTSSAAPSSPSAGSTDDPFGTASPGASAAPKPKLRNTKPRSVYGPTWRRTDDTYTVRLPGLDYAFRVPSDLDCFLAGTTTEASHVRCLRLLAGPSETRTVTLMNRTCAGDRCDGAELRLFESVLVGNENVTWKRKGKATRYAVRRFVDERSGERYFKFYLSHVYPDARGKRGKHVGAVGEAPTGKHAKQIQKTLNDVRTQAG